MGPDRSLRAWGSDASRSASPTKTRPVASSRKPACRTPPRHRLTTTTTTTETMADDEAARKEEVEPSTLPPQTIHSPANAAQRLKSALWYSIGQFVDHQCQLKDRNATPQFIGALTELVWTQIGNGNPSSAPKSPQLTTNGA